MYELKGKDLYSQNGEGLYLEYVLNNTGENSKKFTDIGAGDGIHLSNSKHLSDKGWVGRLIDKLNGEVVTCDNVVSMVPTARCNDICPDFLSIDIDGNDYWILDKYLKAGFIPKIIVAEFNPSFTDSRTIKYNPDHVWDGTDYYGFSFAAGVKLAEKHGYKVIFQTGNMNMFMVRADLIGDLHIPPVTFEKINFFTKSERTDWIFI